MIEVEELLRKNIRDISPYVPGKSKIEIARRYGLDQKKIIKLASNENPLGASKKALKALNVEDINIYPDPEANELRRGISRHLGVKKNQIIVGNGSDEILELAVKIFLNSGEKAVIPIPTYQLYECITRLYSGMPVYVPMGKNFEFDCEKILKNITKKTKLVFICSPNNPTGSVVEEKELQRILENRIAVILDEAYVEFSEHSFVNLVNEYPNLIVLRTFSKAFGLAGLRVGYGVADEKIVNYLLKIKLPFNVDVITQRAALAAIRDKAHLNKTIRTVQRGRKFLFDGLSKINVKVYPSNANFLLVRIEKAPEKIEKELLKRGIIIRNCRPFNGLDERYFRISVGTMEENKKFLDSFREIISTS